MVRLIDIDALRHFKEKILEVVQSMIDASGADADRVVAIEQYVGLYNAFMGTSYNYRDYLSCSTTEIASALDALSKGYNGEQ